MVGRGQQEGGSIERGLKHHKLPAAVLLASALLISSQANASAPVKARPTHARSFELPPRVVGDAASRDRPRNELLSKKLIAMALAKSKLATVHATHVPSQQPERLSVDIRRFSGSLRLWWHKLGVCESGNNPKANTGNGYYGEFQFSRPTWDNQHTGYARADLAPEAVQVAAIIRNTKESGGLSTQNPGCYASQHLSNFPPK